MAASVLVIGAAPATALAGSVSGSPAKAPTIRPGGESHHVRHAGPALMALGSGYLRLNGAPRVRALQRRLAAAGYMPGAIDGRYGPATMQAVERFQNTHGLNVDGIAGPRTMAALVASAAVLYPGAGYQQDDGSPRVRVLQRRLAALGFAPGPIDGRYGPVTARAVERFQRAHRLEVDGVVGVHSWHAMRAVERPAGAPLPVKRPASPSRPGPESRQRHTGQPIAKPSPGHGYAPRLPVRLVLLGLLALGLATASLSYARTRVRIRTHERYPTVSRMLMNDWNPSTSARPRRRRHGDVPRTDKGGKRR